MPVRLFHDNSLFDAATLTTSSQQPNLPAINVQNPLRTKVWRSGTSTALETLTIDFGSAVSMMACIAFFTDIGSSDSLFKISANSSNSFGSPPFTQTLTKVQIKFLSKNYLFNAFGTTTAYRYWQLTYTKASAGVTRDIGRVFLGQTYDILRSLKRDGIQISNIDGSTKSKAVGLNTFVEVLPIYRMITLTFPPLTNSDLQTLDGVFARIGQNQNFFLQIDQTSPYDEIIYVKLAMPFTPKLNAQNGSAIWWDLSLQFEEQV